MNNLPPAIAGTYSDLKFVRTRKVCAITIEIPIEQAEAFIAVFGTPNPASEIWVAMARLQTRSTADDPVLVERKPDEVRRDGGASSGADSEAPRSVPSPEAAPAIGHPIQNGSAVVSEPEAGERGPVKRPGLVGPTHKRIATSQRAAILCHQRSFQTFMRVANEDRAAELMRVHCNVSSRRELDSSPEARARFETLEADFHHWNRQQ